MNDGVKKIKNRRLRVNIKRGLYGWFISPTVTYVLELWCKRVAERLMFIK